MTLVEREPEEYVLKSIRDAYLTKAVRRTRECIEGMARERLFEVDVEKVFMDALATGNGGTAEAGHGGNQNHTRYVIYGKSTSGAQVCCRFASKHLPRTNDFIHWVLTSFEIGTAI